MLVAPNIKFIKYCWGNTVDVVIAKKRNQVLINGAVIVGVFFLAGAMLDLFFEFCTDYLSNCFELFTNDWKASTLCCSDIRRNVLCSCFSYFKVIRTSAFAHPLINGLYFVVNLPIRGARSPN